MPRSVSEPGPTGGGAEAAIKHLPKVKTQETTPKSATTPRGAREYAEANTVGTVSNDGTYTPGATAPSETKATKAERRAAKAKEKRKQHKSERRITGIVAALDADRSVRAKAYETDKSTELAKKYFQFGPEGKILTKTRETPILKPKSSPEHVAHEEHKLKKVIHAFKVQGADPVSLKHLRRAAGIKILKDNYELNPDGTAKTNKVVEPDIVPGKKQEYLKERDAMYKKLHAIEEGSNSYLYQSKQSQAAEAQIQANAEARKAEENDHGGILGELYDITAKPIVDAASHITVPTGPHSAIHAQTPVRGELEIGRDAIGSGIREVDRLFKSVGHNRLEDSAQRESGIPIWDALPDARKSVFHGIHTGALSGAEYLTRPGLAIENALGGGNVKEALLHGHGGKGVINGRQLSEKLFGGPQGGIVLDFATDPTMWVGAGEIKLAEGATLAAATDRIARVAPDLLKADDIAAAVKTARDTGNVSDALTAVRNIAEREGIDLSKLGKTAEDKDAIKAWKKEIAKRQEARVARDSAARKDSKNFLGSKSRMEATEEAGRRELDATVKPGIRLNIQTPTGRELTHIDIKLPEKFADKHIIPRLSRDSRLGELRRSEARASVFKSMDDEITAAEKAAKDARDPEAARTAKANLEDLRDKLNNRLNEAEDKISKSWRMTPKESASLKSGRRYAHELHRVADTQGRSIFHHETSNTFNAFNGLSEKERQQVAEHIREQHETGGREMSNELFPLNAEQEKALKEYRDVQYENARHGRTVGSIDGLQKDYVFRDVTNGPNPLEGAYDLPAHERAAAEKAVASSPNKARGYASSAEFTNRGHFARQLQHLSHGDLSFEEALKRADEWHDRGKIRVAQEDMIHAAQRGNPVHEKDMTDLQREALDWGRGRQKVNNEKQPDLFKNPEKTEGLILPAESAFKSEDSHNFEEDPFGGMSAKEELAVKRQTAEESVARLKNLRDAAERPEVRDDLDHMVMQREAEVKGYHAESDPAIRPMGEKTRVRKLDKIDKVKAKAAGTPYTGERKVFDEAAERMKKELDDAPKANSTKDLRDMLPHVASKEYLGSLRDFRKDHPDAFAILDPAVGDYHRALKDAVKTAYQLRWKAAAKQFGKLSDDPLLQATSDGTVYYHKMTGKEYIFPDNVFEGTIPEGTLLPAQLHSDLKAEFFRMGENVASDLTDEFSSALYQKLNSMTRFTLTTYFPAYHMRNMISDTMNSLLADPGVMFHPTANAKLMEASMTAGKGLTDTIKVAGFDEPIKTEDFLFMMDTLGLKSQEHLAEFAALADKGRLEDAKWYKRNPLGRKGKIGEKAMNYSSRREDIIRAQTFMQRMRRNGGDAADASWHTIKYHFDYADLGRAEKKWARNTFLFYTWYRKNIPLQFLSMIQKPGFFSALTNTQIELAEGGTPLNFNWNKLNPLLPDLSGPVPNSSLIPEYLTKTYAAPVINWNGHAVALSLGLPQADMNLITNGFEDPEGGIRDVIGMTTPLVRAGAELGFSQSLLTGQELKGDENSTLSNLLNMVGVKLPKDDEGKPIVPWQTNVLFNNLFPVIGRGAGYLKPPSATEDHGKFASLFGGGFGTALTGVSAYVGPKEGERLALAQIYKTYERGAAREAIEEKGLSKSAEHDALKKFDEQTLYWGKANAIPKAILQAVPSLGPRIFVSKEDRKVATEEGFFGSNAGEASITGGSEGGGLGDEAPVSTQRKYPGGSTEEALFRAHKAGQGFVGLSATKTPSVEELHDAYNNVLKNAATKHRLKEESKPVVADRLHRGLEPWMEAHANEPTPRQKGYKRLIDSAGPAKAKIIEEQLYGNVPKIKGTGKPADVARAQAKVNSLLDKTGLGKPPDHKELAPKKVKVAKIEGLPDRPSEEFAEALAHYSGMSPEVAAAWTLSEMGGEASGGGAGKYNYLGVGFPGEKTELSEEVPTNSPAAAAKFTSEWLKGTYTGAHPASGGTTGHGINEILPKSEGGKNLQKFAKALEESGWGTDASHVLENAGSVTVNGHDELHEAGAYKIVTSRQQARTVLNIANKFAGTQEGSALQKHWAAEAGISSSEAWCSAFMATLMRRVGLPEPASPASAGTWGSDWKGGKPIGTTDLAAAKPGDIIEFGEGGETDSYADHVGLYLGDGEMISGNFGNEVHRGPISEETRPIQAIVRPHYSGKQVQFKLFTASTPSPGSEAVSGAPTAVSGAATPTEGTTPQAKSTKYQPGQTKRAAIEAKQTRQRIEHPILKGSVVSSESTAPVAGPSKSLRNMVQKVAEEVSEKRTPLEATSKRKPKFRYTAPKAPV